MKNQMISRFRFLAFCFLSLCFFHSCSQDPLEYEKDLTYDLAAKTVKDTTLIEGQYIVVLSTIPGKKNPRALAALEALSKEVGQMHDARISRKYSHVLTGFAAKLTDKQVEKLRKDPRVQYIEQDHYFQLSSTGVVQEYTNWGLDRIDQREGLLDHGYVYTVTGKGVTVYVIDTGVRDSHAEFGNRASLGYDFSVEDPDNDDPALEPGEDCYGHGTPVASIIGGTNYGVAKDVNLVNVKVFSCKGWARASTIVAAVDWVTQNAVKPAIVNASFGYPEAETTVNIAVANSIESGIHFSVSAGNSNDDACKKSPANVGTAVTVGATNIFNEKAEYTNGGSNYGDCVDIYGPGLDVKSASKSDDYSSRFFSGTSAAAPYVAGVMALFLERNPGATPAELHAAIIKNSTPNAVKNVPSGPNNMIYSLWEPVEFTPPPTPNLMLRATGEKVRSNYVANLTWKPTEVRYIQIFEDGIAHYYETYNDGEQQIRLRDKGRNATYTLKICEVGYNNCSEEVIIVFGNGSEEPVNAAPSAGFNYTTNLLGVKFTDTSTDSDGSIISWNWNFGDGNSSTVQNPEHLYAASGTYSVSLTVTDDAGATGSTSRDITVNAEKPQPGEIVLDVKGSKVKGAWKAELSWTPAETSAKVDVYRNGSNLLSTENDGFYIDQTNLKGGGSLTYKVCEAGTTTCSNEVIVQF